MVVDRRQFVAAGAAALAAAVALPYPARAADPFRMIVTETEIPLVPNSVAWLAQSMGYFKKAGVDVELIKVQQTPSAIAALRSGQGDMANVSTDTALQLLGRDQMKLRGVISPDKALPFMIVSKRGLTRPRDLAGKTFGVSRIGSVDYEMTRVVLAKYGVDVEKVQYLAVGQPAVRAQSLLAGQIDATTVSVGIYTTLPDKSNLNVMVGQNDYYSRAPFVTKMNVVTDDVAKSKKNEILAVTRGLINASRDFSRHPELWVNAMAALRPDVKRADLETLAQAYRNSWSVNGGLSLDALQFTTAELYKGPEFKDIKRIEPRDWIDTSFVDTVLRSSGTDRKMDVATR